METLKKISKAIELIKGKNLKKQGRNKFSNYDYYTPDQVSELVTGACHKIGLLPKFDLIRNELGITGQLSVYDIETDAEPVVYHMASEIPVIKATNVAQQLGGAMTYTKRYLLMNAFDIADNNLDFDTTENTKTSNKPAKKELDWDAIATEFKNAKSIAEIKTIWSNHKGLQSVERFINLKEAKKNILIHNGITS